MAARLLALLAALAVVPAVLRRALAGGGFDDPTALFVSAPEGTESELRELLAVLLTGGRADEDGLLVPH